MIERFPDINAFCIDNNLFIFIQIVMENGYI